MGRFKPVIIQEKARPVCFHIILIGIKHPCRHECKQECKDQCVCVCPCYKKIGPLSVIYRHMCSTITGAKEQAKQLLKNYNYLICTFVEVRDVHMELMELVCSADYVP